MTAVEYLTLETVLAVTSRVGFVVKDLGLLDSALARPKAKAFGEDAYVGLAKKGAALAHSMIKNHPFVDGNKRSAFLCLKIFLALNGVILISSDDEMYGFILSIADGSSELLEIADWIEAHSSAV